jgi:hypothetical protein
MKRIYKTKYTKELESVTKSLYELLVKTDEASTRADLLKIILELEIEVIEGKSLGVREFH